MLPALAKGMAYVVDPLHPMTVAPKTAVHVPEVTSENSNAWVCHVKMVFVTCSKAMTQCCGFYRSLSVRNIKSLIPDALQYSKKCLFEV